MILFENISIKKENTKKYLVFYKKYKLILSRLLEKKKKKKLYELTKPNFKKNVMGLFNLQEMSRKN